MEMGRVERANPADQASVRDYPSGEPDDVQDEHGPAASVADNPVADLFRFERASRMALSHRLIA